jgi:hypothetical protein
MRMLEEMKKSWEDKLTYIHTYIHGDNPYMFTGRIGPFHDWMSSRLQAPR